MARHSGTAVRAASASLIALALSALLASTAAHAETGIDVAASMAQETVELPLSTITIDWNRVTVSPWWQNDDWRVSAELPFVQRDAEWRRTNGVLLAAEADAGLGDSRLRATRSWQLNAADAAWSRSAYVSTFVKLPTGDENAGTLVPGARPLPTRQGQYSLGSGTTDVGIVPGLSFANDFAWASVEAGYIFSNGGALPQDDRPTAYLGLGLTPAKFIELSVAFDYEGEVAAGAGTLEQVTYTVALMPVKFLTLTLSTYTDNSATGSDSNWTLGGAVNW